MIIACVCVLGFNSGVRLINNNLAVFIFFNFLLIIFLKTQTLKIDK